MAAKKKAKKKAAAPRITVQHIKHAGTSDAELLAFIKKAQKRKIGFVILNAPFKMRTAKAVS
jgi:hypothetical protein